MKTKIVQLIPVTFVVLVIGFRHLSQWCIVTSLSCYGTWIHRIYISITDPIYNLSLFFFPVAIVLAFVSRNTFKTWLKFAAWALPLAFIFIALTPVSFSGFMDFFPFYRDDAARLWGAIFAVASLVVLAFGFAHAHLSVGREGLGQEEIDRETGELKTVFVAGVGALSIAAAYSMVSASIRGAFSSFIILGGISILTNLYALGYATVLSYRKIRNHTPFGWKLVLAFSLVGITTAAYLGGVAALFWFGKA